MIIIGSIIQTNWNAVSITIAR